MLVFIEAGDSGGIHWTGKGGECVLIRTREQRIKE